MSHRSAFAIVSDLSAGALGIFLGADAVALGVSRNQLSALKSAGIIAREFPDTYRVTAVPRSSDQRLRAALLWAGNDAAAGGRSAGALYNLVGVRAWQPEIVVPRRIRARADNVIVHRSDNRMALMLRDQRGFRTTGIEPTLVTLAAALEDESFEIACEDARRRRLTSVPALRAYLAKYGRGRPGAVAVRQLLDQLDPVYPSRSTLEVKTRRLLVANGITEFVREMPLEWNGRTYWFDFGFGRRTTILETNGRRWHDDPADYEDDNEKWSVPGRHGYRLVFATWNKVTRHPDELIRELQTTFASGGEVPVAQGRNRRGR